MFISMEKVNRLFVLLNVSIYASYLQDLSPVIRAYNITTNNFICICVKKDLATRFRSCSAEHLIKEIRELTDCEFNRFFGNINNG